MRVKKTWLEKLADKEGYPKVLKLEKRFPCYAALKKMGVNEGENIVLVNPSQVVEIMKAVPEGSLITIREICTKLARKFKVNWCCSLTAGIFITTAANAQEEASREGHDLGIPYWRTLKAEGFLNEKFPGGLESHMNLLEKEEYTIRGRGKRYSVQDYEQYLVV